MSITESESSAFMSTSSSSSESRSMGATLSPLAFLAGFLLAAFSAGLAVGLDELADAVFVDGFAVTLSLLFASSLILLIFLGGSGVSSSSESSLSSSATGFAFFFVSSCSAFDHPKPLGCRLATILASIPRPRHNAVKSCAPRSRLPKMFLPSPFANFRNSSRFVIRSPCFSGSCSSLR